MRPLIFTATLAGLAFVNPGNDATAAWPVDGVLYSNICRSIADPSQSATLSPQDAEPVGSPCLIPDASGSTKDGIITAQ